MTPQDLALTILSSASFSGIATIIIVFLARSWISERLKNSIQHEYDLKLTAVNNELKIHAEAQSAQLKASIEKEAEKTRFATTSIGESIKTAIMRKFAGIDTLWIGVLNIRRNIPAVMSFIDILTVDEYMSMSDHPHFKKLVGEISAERLSTIYEDNVGSIERVRPYVGEYLWAIFSIYQSLVLRISVIMQMGEKDPQKLNWHQDDVVRQLIKSSLSSEEVKAFDTVDIGKVGWLQKKYEARILQAMNKIISGEEFGKEALRQAEQMEAKIAEVKQKEDSERFSKAVK